MIQGLRLIPGCILATVAALIFSQTCGCGYRLEGSKTGQGEAVQSLAVPLMESPSSSRNFEVDFTRMIREEFASHAGIPLVSREEAAAVLIGEVEKVEVEPLAYRVEQDSVNGEQTSFEVTKTRRLRIRLQATLLDRVTGRVIWKDESMEDKANYAVTGDPLKDRYHRREAIRRIAQRLAERIYARTLERF